MWLSLFLNSTCDIGGNTWLGHATLPFLKIDMRHAPSPSKAPRMEGAWRIPGGGGGVPWVSPMRRSMWWTLAGRTVHIMGWGGAPGQVSAPEGCTSPHQSHRAPTPWSTRPDSPDDGHEASRSLSSASGRGPPREMISIWRLIRPGAPGDGLTTPGVRDRLLRIGGKGGGGGLQSGSGRQVKLYRYEKRGGAQIVLAILKGVGVGWGVGRKKLPSFKRGRGAKTVMFWSSIYPPQASGLEGGGGGKKFRTRDFPIL